MLRKFTFVRAGMLALVVMFMTTTVFAQNVVSGTVIDGTNNEPLIGASVSIKGTSIGTTTDVDGKYTLSEIPSGSETLVFSFIGFERQEIAINNASIVDITLAEDSNVLGEIIVVGVADFARDRHTPVAVSTIKADEIEAKLGNQELPELLNSTPSVYATKSGGGYGDSRINIRGFDQKNTAVLINGVPVNDMENGWVYWSNWAGLGEVTTAMQVQRGLGSSKLAISSVGGTINVITKTSDKKQGGSIGAVIGNDNFLKTTATYNTGLYDSGFSASFLFSRTAGDGYVDGTQFEGYNYFMGLGYLKGRHNLQLTVTGAPQTHNQRTTSFYNMATLGDYVEYGNKYNYNHGYKDGEEFNWRKNFYHKPIASLNWDWSINEKTSLFSVAYASVGRGGGTGDIGSDPSFPSSSRFRDPANGQVDWDKIVDYNGGEEVTFYNDQTYQRTPDENGEYINESRGAGVTRRASMNSHNWFGLISNINHKLNDYLTLDVGIDIRTYKGIHYRRIDNLLGSDGYYDDDNINIPEGTLVRQSDINNSDLGGLWNVFKSTDDDVKIDYYNDGLSRWTGAFTQLEYQKGKISAFVQGAVSNQGYKRVEHFLRSGADQESDWENILGGNIKGGININLDEHNNIFGNLGYYSKQPLFDAVWINYDNILNEDHENEEIVGVELGYGYRSQKFNANVNLYRTSWKNRFITVGIEVGGNQGNANVSGVQQIHSGIEFDANYRVNKFIRFNGMMSIGNWEYGGDVSAKAYNSDQELVGEATLYLDGVKVGDAAQFTALLGVVVTPVNNLNIDVSWRKADNLYAAISAEDFDSPDHQGSLKLPGYDLVDAGLSYRLPIGKNKEKSLSFRLNVNNVFNTEYISESATNYHARDGDDTYMGISTGNKVFFGFGTTWNTGLKFNF